MMHRARTQTIEEDAREVARTQVAAEIERAAHNRYCPSRQRIDMERVQPITDAVGRASGRWWASYYAELDRSWSAEGEPARRAWEAEAARRKHDAMRAEAQNRAAVLALRALVAAQGIAITPQTDIVVSWDQHDHPVMACIDGVGYLLPQESA